MPYEGGRAVNAHLFRKGASKPRVFDHPFCEKGWSSFCSRGRLPPMQTSGVDVKKKGFA